MGWFGGGNDNLQGGSSTDGFPSDLGDGTANQYGGSSNFASGSEGKGTKGRCRGHAKNNAEHDGIGGANAAGS